ncbi:hypothetical protein IT41_14315 [Paracoccus halophilus]|nr:hypothetical protein IT41_14315 [Paracoccus halophilus]
MIQPGQRPLTPADLDEAFQKGYAQGLPDGRRTSLDALSASMDVLRQEIAAVEAVAASSRRETVASLAPVLSAMVELLGTHSDKRRMGEALRAELLRLSESAPQKRLRIRCAAALRPEVELCLKKTNLTQVSVEEISGDTASVDLIADKATITFDTARTTAELQSIIKDIVTEE